MISSTIKFLNKSKIFNPLAIRVSKSFSTDPFKAKEAGEEKIFVSQTEREVLKKLLNKVKKNLDADEERTEITDLKAVLKKHKIALNDELIKELRHWRDIHH